MTENACETIAVLGATGRTGRRLVETLGARADLKVIAVGRDLEKLQAVQGATERRVATFEDTVTLTQVLADADRVINAAHAGFTADILPALPSGLRRFVVMGSTRRYTMFPDAAADRVRAAEDAISARPDIPTAIVHPTMIYGPLEERNIARVLDLVRRVPIIPLPRGGVTLVQPVFADDVVLGIVGATFNEGTAHTITVLPGAAPLSYADMVRACATALGRRVWILPVPYWLCFLFLPLARLVGVSITSAELRRVLEDKAFSTVEAETRLGVKPRSFAEGLRLKLERGWYRR